MRINDRNFKWLLIVMNGMLDTTLFENAGKLSILFVNNNYLLGLDVKLNVLALVPYRKQLEVYSYCNTINIRFHHVSGLAPCRSR